MEIIVRERETTMISPPTGQTLPRAGASDILSLREACQPRQIVASYLTVISLKLQVNLELNPRLNSLISKLTSQEGFLDAATREATPNRL